MEYRFRDKAYLSGYLMDTRIFNNYDFLVEDAAPVRTAYFLTTDKGMKIFKKISYGKEELLFLYDTLNKIRKSYPFLINFKETTSNKPYVEYDGSIYIVLDVINGREAVYENPIDLKTTCSALSKLHRASEGIEFNLECRDFRGKMIEKFRKKVKDMEMYREIADLHVHKSDFDNLYLSYYDYYINNARESLKRLDNSNYKTLSLDKGTLCHHDLAHHNILIDLNGNAHFIDFDYSIVDHPSHDIANIITKAIKHNNWNTQMADSCIEAYCENSPLSRDDIEILLCFLSFPQDFYDITTCYYMRTKDWDEDEFIEKLKRRGEYKSDREKFLNEFEKRWT